ncbi:MAG TPA: SLC45 family MFS transporter [Erysipelothrix sp.]|jgi:Na+/melibiose symporter-like transporter|nr:SLC45 family MFS transporter [Erysipelothrix sp.]
MKLDVKRTLLVGIAFMTISSFWQLYDFAVPLMLKNDLGVSDTLSGVVMSLDNILALFMLPFFGALSDKTMTKFGKRMPFIIIGTITTVIGLLMIPYAASHGNLLLFMIALGIVLIFVATYRSPAVALMPDVTIKPLRSKGNAIINLMGAIGGVVALFGISLLKPQDIGYFPVFLMVAGFMLLGLVVMMVTIKENQWAKEMEEDTLKYNIEESEEDLHSDEELPSDVKRSLWFILLSISLWFMGYNAVISAFSRYATIQIGLSDSQASQILLVANVGAIISFIPVGQIASKLGRKKTILFGVTLLTVVFGTAFFYKTFSPLMYVNFVLAGTAWAAINVNSLPMVLEMAKAGDVGRYTGLYYTFSMSAQIVTPILSGVLFDLIGYEVLFPYAAFFVALALVTMSQVKHGDTTVSKFVE